MKKTILKFRAWGGDKMFIISELSWYTTKENERLVSGNNTFRGAAKDYYGEGFTNFFCPPTMSSDVLMQFTGLYDKKGKEIYEGDIVYNEIYIDKPIKDGYYKVGFENGAFTFNKQNISSLFSIDANEKKVKDVEVVGNIYENPELLEKIHEMYR